jgi:Ca-activated chloride channel family protein
MKVLNRVSLGLIAAIGLALPVVAAERAIIVLDGSGSMWAQIDGEARITIARDTLSEVLSTIPDSLELGLMTYGHREKGNCGDIEMLVEAAAGNAAAINAAAAKINPKGMTPLSDAVRLAAEELRYTEEDATVILITDGLETCEVDPCAFGLELENQGINFTAHVLGFGLSDEEGSQVACLAENTGGKYLSANDGDALVEALTTTVAEVVQAEPAPEPEPEPQPVALDYNLVPTASLSEGGPDMFDDRGNLVWRLYEVAPDGGRGEMIRTEYNSNAKFDVEPGEYHLQAEFGYAEVMQKLTVGKGELAEPHFVLNAAIITVKARRVAGENPSNDIGIRLHFPGDQSTHYGEGTFRVPAGDMRMVTYVDAIEQEETFTVAAGETIEKDIVLGSARVLTNADYVEGSEVTASGLSTKIYKAKKALDGTREQVSFGYGPNKGFDLPPGDYVAVFELEYAIGEAAFSVGSGEEIEVNGVLDAGVVAFAIPGIESARIYDAKKSIEGTRRELATTWYEEWQRTFNAGDYVIVTRLDDGTEFEVPFTVIAGERLELDVVPSAAGTPPDEPSKSKSK